MFRRSLFAAAALLMFSMTVYGQDTYSHENENCFSIIAGRLATADGSVLFAHNEDDGGRQMLNVYNVPADPAAGTLAYKWIEFPGMKTADSFMNECGVCICSDNCGSREDCEPGEWLYEIRTSVARYAKTAREGVDIIGRAIEEHGYQDAGRSYMIADPDEGWIVSVVKGHHWAAMRVPDDKVLLIPNYHVIDRVDLSDRENFAGSPDLVEYAVRRGWYDPERDGEFSFRKVYGSSKSFESAHNIDRHRDVLAAVTGGTYNYDVWTVQPMITPSRRLNVSDLASCLSIHGPEDGSGKHMENVCVDRTVVSLIFQLRKDMPLELGCLMWMCPGRPCAEAYLPVYLGAELPSDFGRYSTPEEALQKHFKETKDFRTQFPSSFYWCQADRWKNLSEDYSGRIADRQKARDKVQKKLYKAQAPLEKKVMKLLSKGDEASAGKAAGIMSEHLRRSADLCR